MIDVLFDFSFEVIDSTENSSKKSNVGCQAVMRTESKDVESLSSNNFDETCVLLYNFLIQSSHNVEQCATLEDFQVRHAHLRKLIGIK